MVMVAPRGAVRNRHLAPVASGPVEGPLAERLAAAQAAVGGLRQRAADLGGALAVAVEAADFAEAARIQPELQEAQEALALVELELKLAAETQGAIEQARQETEQKVADARRHDDAQRRLSAASAAEQEALDAADAALGVVRSNLLAARAAFDQVRAFDDAAYQARLDGKEARRALGEWPERDPGPTVVGSCKAQDAASRDPLIRALSEWRP